MTDRALQIIEYLNNTVLKNLECTGENVFIGDANFFDSDSVPGIGLALGENVTLGDQGQLTSGFIDRNLQVRITYALFDNDERKYYLLSEINASIFAAMASSYDALKIALPWVLDYWLDGDLEPNITNEASKDLFTQEVIWVFHYRHSLASAES